MSNSAGTVTITTQAERDHWGPIPAQDRPQLLERARCGANTACVDCGATPIDGGLRCPPCFLVCCAGRTALQRCGTTAAYKRHQRAGERPCGACRNAHATEEREAYRRRRVA